MAVCGLCGAPVLAEQMPSWRDCCCCCWWCLNTSFPPTLSLSDCCAQDGQLCHSDWVCIESFQWWCWLSGASLWWWTVDRAAGWRGLHPSLEYQWVSFVRDPFPPLFTPHSSFPSSPAVSQLLSLSLLLSPETNYAVVDSPSQPALLCWTKHTEKSKYNDKVVFKACSFHILY